MKCSLGISNWPIALKRKSTEGFWGTCLPNTKREALGPTFTPSFLFVDFSVRGGSDVWRHGNQPLTTKGRPRETLEVTQAPTPRNCRAHLEAGMEFSQMWGCSSSSRCSQLGFVPIGWALVLVCHGLCHVDCSVFWIPPLPLIENLHLWIYCYVRKIMPCCLSLIN